MPKVARIRTRKHSVVLNRSRGGDGVIIFFMTIFGAAMFFPFVYATMQSLKPLDELFIFPPRFYVVHPTFRNYLDLFKLMGTSWVPFSRYIFNTVFISVAGTAGSLILSSMAAYALSKIKFPGRRLLFELVIKSMMFNAVAAGMAVFIIMSALHMLDNYTAILIPTFGSTLGLYLMKQFMDSNVSDSILESARLDGASEFRTFLLIAMPMVKPAWLTLIIMSFQGLWNYGSTIYIYTEQLKTFNYALGQILSGGIVRQGAAAASIMVMAIVPIIVFVVTQSSIIETMGTSGMKD